MLPCLFMTGRRTMYTHDQQHRCQDSRDLAHRNVTVGMNACQSLTTPCSQLGCSYPVSSMFRPHEPAAIRKYITTTEPRTALSLPTFNECNTVQ
jgi:hypothetical protein